jgi:tetrahydromethanopterin S-methyltransferase subunit F
MESIENTLHLIAQDQNLMISLGVALTIGIILVVVST